MARKIKFVPGETYHCYTRGVNKQLIFNEEEDYMRLMTLLLLCNGTESVCMKDTLKKYQGDASGKYKCIFDNEAPTERLVDILTHSLMPNHLHIILREREEGSISAFTQRLFTAYSMYFNKKYERTGPLFEKPFKAKHINNEAYFRWVFSYVHLNAVSIIEPKWEEKGIIIDPERVRAFMREYKWSSYRDYAVGERPESAILSMNEAPDFLKEIDDLEEMLEVYANQTVISKETLKKPL